MKQHPNQRSLPETTAVQMFSPTSLVEKYLTVQTRIHGKDMTVEEAEVWKKKLSHYSDSAIEYAFEAWERNGKFFPKPAEIIELIDAHNQSHLAPLPRYENHGGGLNEKDVLAMYKLFLERWPKPIGRKLTQDEKDQFLSDFHQRRNKLHGAA